MEWFTNLLQKNKDVKIDSNNNISNIDTSDKNDKNDKNDGNNNINETIDSSSSGGGSSNSGSNSVNDKNDVQDIDKNEMNDKNDNDGIDTATESSLPKKCYTLDELRRVEKRLGKMELPDDISEYVNSGDFRSISKSTGQSNNMGKRQGQGQGQGQQLQNRGYGNRQVPNQGQGAMQGQRQGNGQGQGIQGNGQGQNFRNPKQGDDSWSRNRTLPQQQESIQNNNNNNNNNYERKLTIAEQKLLFEQERKKILAERQKEYDDIADGEPVLQFRDETDILLEEMAGNSNQSNRAGSEGTKISFNTLLSSSEGDRSHQHHAPVDSNGNSVVIQFSSLNATKEEVIPAPVQPDIWSSFLDTNLSPDIFGDSLFGNQAPSSSRRGQSRLGAILSLEPSPLKSDTKLAFDNDDTLDLANPSLFTDALPPSPNSKANNRLNIQSLFSAARQNPNSNPSPESSIEHKIIKSSDVLSRLGFEGPQSSEPSPPQDSSPTPPNSSSSPFTFHGQDSSAKKTKKQSGGMSVASRMQLMKMGKKIENGDKSKPVETSAAPVTPIKNEIPPPPPTPPAASGSEASVPTNMKRINLNSLFVKQG